jgi:hypothetical protein
LYNATQGDAAATDQQADPNAKGGNATGDQVQDVDFEEVK